MDPNANPVPDTKVLDTQEFFEDQSQKNALNAKRTYDEFQDISLVAARRSQTNFDNLQQVALRSLNQSVELQAQLNAKILNEMEDSRNNVAAIHAQARRFEADAEYVTRYDLSNPVTTGTGDALRSTAYTPNRAADIAASGVGVSAEAIAAAVAKSVDATITPVLAVLQQIIALLTAQTKPTTSPATA